MIKITTGSREETVNIGQRLGKLLKKGDVICLTGDLGAGKTAFTNGIALGMGIGGYVTSPTFTIVNEYCGNIQLYHFDVYRILDPDELFDIGFEDYIDGLGVVVIEWADMIRTLLPADYIQITIRKNLSLGEDARDIEINFIGERYRTSAKDFELSKEAGGHNPDSGS